MMCDKPNWTALVFKHPLLSLLSKWRHQTCSLSGKGAVESSLRHRAKGLCLAVWFHASRRQGSSWAGCILLLHGHWWVLPSSLVILARWLANSWIQWIFEELVLMTTVCRTMKMQVYTIPHIWRRSFRINENWYANHRKNYWFAYVECLEFFNVESLEASFRRPR